MKEEEESEKETESEREIDDNGKGYFRNIWKNLKCFFKETLEARCFFEVLSNLKNTYKCF